MLIDSHCHLDRVDLKRHGGDFDRMMRGCAEAGVVRMLCVAIDLDHYPAMRRLVDPYPTVDLSVGVHPNEDGGIEPSVERLVDLASDPRVVAIGETGLDYYRLEGDPSGQQDRFRTHIAAARICRKPLIIHTREAREDTIRLLREEGADETGGVLHCFTETWEMARQGLDLGFFVSFSGILTFKSAEALREVARQVPLDRLLIETDSPYLAPVPYRGKSNEPSYLGRIAACLGEIRGLDPEQVAAVTQDNYRRLFGGDREARRASAAGGFSTRSCD
ncbi:TatD family hydrolase [Thiocystis violacea]|uniref:TatD family hydrolase n=1 Tax=Thiocystis violacea TaxID=13725 RepID=UPI001908B838|nr:TatD family hydrolase [Thiocystis violacea]MBK1719476.1 TatD family deoxyribonuclease [Thiocystis violacea]